jgi:transcriptional regulator of heat shock response
MARTRKRITKENVVEEDEVQWSEMDRVTSELADHVENRVLPFCKFFSSTIHQAHWAEHGRKQCCSVDDSVALAAQLKNLIDQQADWLKELEEMIAKNRAVIAMRFCT